MDSSSYFILLFFVLAASSHGVQSKGKQKKVFDKPKGMELDSKNGFKHSIIPMPEIKIPLWVDSRTKFDPLIVNGNETNPGDYPFHVILLRSCGLTDWCFVCGGSLLSPYHVLTAAHCVTHYSGSHYIVVAGLHDRRKGINGNPGAQASLVNVTNVHPGWNYNPRGYPNDVAVLTLSSPISQNANVGYAKVATTAQMKTFDKAHCVVTGYGRDENRMLSQVLRVGRVYTLSIQDCRALWAAVTYIQVNYKHICGIDRSSGVCAGDSGGPITCGGDTVVGIVSWGLTSCSTCFPDVHTRVSSYYDWIRGAMGIEQD